MMTSREQSRRTRCSMLASGAALLFALAAGCSSGGSDAPPPQSKGPFEGSWLGSYRTDQQPSTVFQADLTQNGNQVSGTVTTGAGGIQSGNWFGAVTSASATITFEETKAETGASSVTKAVATSNVTITQTKPGCPGSYNGTATVDGTTLTLSFSGSDCNGPQTNGQAVLARQGSVPGSPAPSADVTGTWSGTYTDTVDRGAIPLSFTLSQAGGTVTGTYAVGSAVNTTGERGTKAVFGVNRGTMTGTVSANVFSFAATQSPPCQGTVSGTATVTGGTMALAFKGLDCNNQQQGGEGTITRQGPPPPGSDNNLAALTVTPVGINFDPNQTNYAVTVDSGISTVGLSASKSDPNAVMTGAVVAGEGQASGQANVALGIPGSTTPISITVTAPNKLAKTYTISVTRTALAGNNNLSALSVSPGSLSPAFNPGTLDYTVNVDNGVGSVTVSATKSDPNANMTGSLTAGAGQGSAQSTIQLNGPGTSTPVNITVTAPDGSSKQYAIAIVRAAPGGNNNLANLSVSSLNAPGLNPSFNSGTATYTGSVLTTIGSVTVTATPEDAAATVSINGQSGGSRSVTLASAGSTTPIAIVVTAPNGSTRTYNVNITRANVSCSTNLIGLTVEAKPLPGFTPSITSYSFDVGSGTSSVQVGATATAPAGVSLNGQSTNPLTVTLNPAGQNTVVSIAVTCPSQSPRIYTLTINRTALPSNANLTSFQAFNEFGVIALTEGVPNRQCTTLGNCSYTGNSNSTSVRFTATKSDTGATLKILGPVSTQGLAVLYNTAGPGDSTAEATLPFPNTCANNPPTDPTITVRLEVTAQDGVTVRTTTITITSFCIT